MYLKQILNLEILMSFSYLFIFRKISYRYKLIQNKSCLLFKTYYSKILLVNSLDSQSINFYDISVHTLLQTKQ